MSNEFSRRSLLRAGGLTLGGLALGSTLAACGGGSSQSSTSNVEVGSTLDEIIEGAKKEGTINLIALPPTWANYKGVLEEFRKEYGIETTVDSPNASSADELKAVKQFRGKPKMPDSIDVGYSFTAPAKEQKALGIYKPSTWDSIPDALKDPEGYWVGSYYGVISLGVNAGDVPVPRTLADLKKPEYKGKVAIPGDPRKGASSVASVITAAVANGGGVDNVEPGIDFFAELTEMGNMVTISDVNGALANGQASVVFDWSYNFVGFRPELERNGIKLETVIPEDAVFGTYYAQGITPDSPHPNAARLWIDWIIGDKGAEQYALGGAVPGRYEALVADGKLSDEALAKLPDAEQLKAVKFPTIEEGDAANKLIAEQWGSKVKA